MTTIQQEISDPEDPLGKKKISLRENLWDEENRLLAVDLKPEAPSNKPEVAAYTYDASGERTIKYLPGRLDAYYSAKAAGSADRLESILYPSPLLTVKTRPLPEHMEPDELSRTSITKYTKHYYIGTERIASAIGTMKNLGLLCENNWPGNNDLVNEMGTKTIDAGDVLIADYDAFEKELQLSEPFIYETYLPCEGKYHEPINYAAYWYHPDHLGSSSYITNTSGEVSQHMEYLPFGETLVEEHLNSYNSPYKFNAKEYDAETGWYYYGARYYNPKCSIWLSVDAEFAKFPSWSPYNYTLQNPVRYIDPDGNSPFDHYFSSDGRYLGSDNRSTNNIRVMQNSYGASGVLLSGFDAEYAYNNSTTLSSFNYSDKQNARMLKNVASHYQNEVGLSANGPMDVRDHDTSVMHVVGDGPAINVSRQLGTTINQLLDDANNFMNSIIHEDGHRRDGSPTNFEHTSNYLTQSKHDTWMDTTTEYKNASSMNTANLLNRALKEDGVSKQAIQNRVNEFNAVPFGIQLHYNENTNSVVPVTQLEPVNMNNN